MFEFFRNKENKENKKLEAFQNFRNIRNDMAEQFYNKDKEIRKELKKYEFLIETLYKTKHIDKIKACYGQISEDYTNTELIGELGIFNKDVEEKLINWSNKYNELINNRKQLIEDYNKQINELKEKLDEYYK